MRASRSALLLAGTCATLLASCGDGPAAPGGATPTPRAAAGSRSCPKVNVPAHEAMDIVAVGTDCGVASAVAKAAEGLGRAQFTSNGFACAPTDAPGGDTYYACMKGDAKVTFRYGTA